MMRPLIVVVVCCGITGVLWSAATSASAGAAATATATKAAVPEVEFTGKVSDVDGKPVAGAVVTAYAVRYDERDVPVKPGQQTKTDDGGEFRLTVSRVKRVYHLVLVKSEGFATGWAMPQVGLGQAMPPVTVTLAKPAPISGTVTSEDGTAIAGATVNIIMGPAGTEKTGWNLIGMVPGMDWLSAKTDDKGRFEFQDVPANVKATFTVTAEGFAPISPYGRGNLNLQYAAGQKDIQIKMAKEAVLEVTAVDKSTGSPVAGIPVQAMPTSGYIPQKAITTGTDGKAVFKGLPGGQVRIGIANEKDVLPDWISSELATANVANGQTTKDVKLELIKGVVVEFDIADSEGKTAGGAGLHGYNTARQETYFNSFADDKGHASVRVMPGEYQVNYYWEMQNQNITQTISDQPGQKFFLKFAPPLKVTGTVVDPSGKPVAGAEVRPLTESVVARTGADGKFEISFKTQYYSSMPGSLALVAQVPDRDLAAMVRVEDVAKEVEIKLAPTVTLTGSITDVDGKPMPGIQVNCSISVGQYGLPYMLKPVASDANGRFKIPRAVTDQKYSLHIEAKGGFGRGGGRVFTVPEDATGEFEVDKTVLRRADQSVSGIVVDKDDKPVGGIQVYAGNQDSVAQGLTDAEGKFKLDGLTAEQFYVQANTGGGNKDSERGMVMAQPGDKNVKVILGRNQQSRRDLPTEPVSLKGKPLPAVKHEGLKAALAKAAGKTALLCVWEMDQRPGKRMLAALAAVAKKLDSQGVAIVTLCGSEASPEQAQAWLKQNKLDLPVVAAGADGKTNQALLMQLGVRSSPWLILVDPNGVVKADGVTLEEALKLLEATPPATAPSPASAPASAPAGK